MPVMANSIFKHFQTVFYSEAFAGDGGDWRVFPSKGWAVFCWTVFPSEVGKHLLVLVGFYQSVNFSTMHSLNCALAGVHQTLATISF